MRRRVACAVLALPAWPAAGRSQGASAVPAQADAVTVVAGDAFAEFPKLAGEFDFVFLDAWKPDYQRFFDLLLPRLRGGGVFLAHIVVNYKVR